MYVDSLELTMSHVDLGGLTEPIFIALCGDAHAHRITHGRDNSIDAIVDKHGKTLYPGHYATHLSVPPDWPLHSFRLWDRISVGADVRAYAGMLLDATYVLGPEGAIADNPESWDIKRYPSMRGGVVFVVKDEGHEGAPEPAVPQPEQLAELPKLKAPPHFIDNFSRVRDHGMVDRHFAGSLQSPAPMRYRLCAGRDVATGQALMFSSFARLIGLAERWLLERAIRPPFPTALFDHFRVLERETYFLGNCVAGDTLAFDVRASIHPCEPGMHGADRDMRSLAVLTTSVEISNDRTNALINCSKGQSLLVIPTAREQLLKDAERVLLCHQDTMEGTL